MSLSFTCGSVFRSFTRGMSKLTFGEGAVNETSVNTSNFPPFPTTSWGDLYKIFKYVIVCNYYILYGALVHIVESPEAWKV